jgi:hypothetical protein
VKHPLQIDGTHSRTPPQSDKNQVARTFHDVARSGCPRQIFPSATKRRILPGISAAPVGVGLRHPSPPPPDEHASTATYPAGQSTNCPYEGWRTIVTAEADGVASCANEPCGSTCATIATTTAAAAARSGAGARRALSAGARISAMQTAWMLAGPVSAVLRVGHCGSAKEWRGCGCIV